MKDVPYIAELERAATDPIPLRTAGSVAGAATQTEDQNWWFFPGPCSCGRITDGVGLAAPRPDGAPASGGFVVDFRDLERAYFAARIARGIALPTLGAPEEKPS